MTQLEHSLSALIIEIAIYQVTKWWIKKDADFYGPRTLAPEEKWVLGNPEGVHACSDPRNKAKQEARRVSVEALFKVSLWALESVLQYFLHITQRLLDNTLPKSRCTHFLTGPHLLQHHLTMYLSIIDGEAIWLYRTGHWNYCVSCRQCMSQH